MENKLVHVRCFMQSTRQYLKKLENHQKRKLFDLCNLTDEERKILIGSFVRREFAEKTAGELAISRRQYHFLLNVALAKVECKILELDKIHNL